MRCFGYTRAVDTSDQRLQENALTAAGCEQIFSDLDGEITERENLFSIIQPGDKLIIWRLDKFALSVSDFSKQLDICKEQGVSFLTLQESLKLDSVDNSELFHQLVAAMANIEKNLDKGNL